MVNETIANAVQRADFDSRKLFLIVSVIFVSIRLRLKLCPVRYKQRIRNIRLQTYAFFAQHQLLFPEFINFTFSEDKYCRNNIVILPLQKLINHNIKIR